MDLTKQKKQYFLALAICALVINLCFWKPAASSYTPAPQPYVGRTEVQPHYTPAPAASPVSTAPSSYERSRPAFDTGRRADADRETAQLPDPAVERAQLRAKYINSEIDRLPNVTLVALLVATDNRRIDKSLTRALSSHFHTEDIQITDSFFNPEFVADGLFNDLFSDSRNVINKLELERSIDGLILGRESVSYTTNTSLENVISAETTLDVMVRGMKAGSQSESWTFRATGAGFTPNAAKAMACERIFKKLNVETNMSLTPIKTSP